MSKSLLEFLDRLKEEVPSKLEMMEELDVDIDEIARAVVGHALLMEMAGPSAQVDVINGILDWGYRYWVLLRLSEASEALGVNSCLY